MKNCIKYLIFAISLFLTLSSILDAFADDNRFKIRYRYQWGSQKVDDDNHDHDRNDYLKPVTNQTYKETCGDCHFAYQPGLLPSASWLKVLNQLDDHFGEAVALDPDVIKNISDYLMPNAAEYTSAKLSLKIMRSLGR